jgi:hypothetical protein
MQTGKYIHYCVCRYKIEVPADVPVDGFWSITVYNATGHMAYVKNTASRLYIRAQKIRIHCISTGYFEVPKWGRFGAYFFQIFI